MAHQISSTYSPAAAFAPWADRAQVPGMRPSVDTTAKTQRKREHDDESECGRSS